MGPLARGDCFLAMSARHSYTIQPKLRVPGRAYDKFKLGVQELICGQQIFLFKVYLFTKLRQDNYSLITNTQHLPLNALLRR